MITFTQGNLLESSAQALVNTVNTVGVMGKGIALMFKERFPDNFHAYAAACKAEQVQIGKMFITRPSELDGPQWIINFPTKQHWKARSRIEWIQQGLQDLRHFLLDHAVESVAIPPLGAGNGGLDWAVVKEQIQAQLGDLDMDITVYEPTSAYQNVAKRSGTEKLTPARALIAELVRCYGILGMECSLLEVHKLAWFLERCIQEGNPDDNPLDLRFQAHHYGPYATRLTHLLNHLDGSYLHCEKRINDANPFEPVWFDEKYKDRLRIYLQTEAAAYLPALRRTIGMIEGFESPYGMELLATVDWLLTRERVEPRLDAVRQGLQRWPSGKSAADRKQRIFHDDQPLRIAIEHLAANEALPA